MIFPGDHTPLRKLVLQDAKFSADIQEKINSLLHTFEDIIYLSSNDIHYTNQIEMDTDTNPNSPFIASKSYTVPL